MVTVEGYWGWKAGLASIGQPQQRSQRTRRIALFSTVVARFMTM